MVTEAVEGGDHNSKLTDQGKSEEEWGYYVDVWAAKVMDGRGVEIQHTAIQGMSFAID